MATHSSILAWRIPWTEEPGGLQSIGSQRVEPDRAISLSLGAVNDSHPLERSWGWYCRNKFKKKKKKKFQTQLTFKKPAVNFPHTL